MIRDLVKDFLRHAGYEAMLFSSAEEYIDYVNSDAFCFPVAVFTDIRMPGMAGYEMLQILSALKPEMKFVVMTGEYSTPSVHIGKACMYLTKPFRLSTFMKIVDSLVHCHECGPSSDHGCENSDSRKKFPIGEWQCPHKDNTTGSGASAAQGC